MGLYVDGVGLLYFFLEIKWMIPSLVLNFNNVSRNCPFEDEPLYPRW